jgi:hypothetical protein
LGCKPAGDVGDIEEEAEIKQSTVVLLFKISVASPEVGERRQPERRWSLAYSVAQKKESLTFTCCSPAAVYIASAEAIQNQVPDTATLSIPFPGRQGTVYVSRKEAQAGNRTIKK